MMQLRIDLLSELGLYRKCVKICEEILSNSEGLQPRAALLLSRSYLKLNRLAECKDTAHLALKGLTASDDVYTARYLQILSEGVDQFPEPISSPSKAQIIDDRTSGIEIHSKRLQDLQQKYLGNGPGQVAEPLARMVMRDLSYATGDEAVDMLLVLGNAQMNYGNIAPAIEIFEGVLKCNDLVLAAHLGLGSALALTGQFDTAVEHFTRAISIDPTVMTTIHLY